MADRTRVFRGRWITAQEFAPLEPANVFAREAEAEEVYRKLPERRPQNRHILFRKKFCFEPGAPAILYISADDYYKLYINGVFVTQGPSPAYPCHYYYNAVDVTGFLAPGENVIAVHTYYQGLINRVWVSGDLRHGLIFDLVSGGKCILSTDDSFLTHQHTAFSACGKSGYDTQFMERYDSRAPEVGFERPDFDDSAWENAVYRQNADYELFEQPSKQLALERIAPVKTGRNGNTVFFDFGKQYVGGLSARAEGESGKEITLHCGAELNKDGSVRFQMRCNCTYEEFWVLSGKEDELNQYDYKAFRYAEIILPEGCALVPGSVALIARHYPFQLKAKPDTENEKLISIWNLCVHSMQYGAQEVLQDCPDREKGQYLGDGNYTAMTHLVLSGDGSFTAKFIDDCFRSAFINPGLMACISGSFMQEMAEHPLILPILLLAYYHVTGDEKRLREWFRPMVGVLEYYREQYEREDHLLYDLDKWCVVDWPKDYRDGYDYEVMPAKVNLGTHNIVNAYYIGAIRMVNRIAQILGEPEYRDAAQIRDAYIRTFYVPEKHLFKDTPESGHISMPGNMIAFLNGIFPDDQTQESMIGLIRQKGLTSCMINMVFPMLAGLKRIGRDDLIEELMLDEKGWLNAIREGATATIEGWSRDTKWNTSLFHLMMSDAALFLTDWDMRGLLNSF